MVSQNPKPYINYHLQAFNNIPKLPICKKVAVQRGNRGEKKNKLTTLVSFFLWFKHRNVYHRGKGTKQNLLLPQDLNTKKVDDKKANGTRINASNPRDVWAKLILRTQEKIKT